MGVEMRGRRSVVGLNSMDSEDERTIDDSEDSGRLLVGTTRRSPSGDDDLAETDGSSSHPPSRSSSVFFSSSSPPTSPLLSSSSSSSCPGWVTSISKYMNSTRLMVLLILCLQNSLYTVLRRYSQGVLEETYSRNELLLVAELIKIVFSSWMVSKLNLPEGIQLQDHLKYLVRTSQKMFVLAGIYGAMNILSFVSLRNISAGMFTIFAQCKILTTASFSTLILGRKYSWTKWRALIALMMGVLLFSEPIWDDVKPMENGTTSSALIGTLAVIIEVTLSGFASIYFEKVIKMDPQQLGIWERNFQLALGSFPVYLVFIAMDGSGSVGQGWSWMAVVLAFLGAAGGLLVALSIKYGDSILKTLATTGAIVLTGILDHVFLSGPLTPAMMIAAVQVIIAICNYTFDATPPTNSSVPSSETTTPSKGTPSSSRIRDVEAGTGTNEKDGTAVLNTLNSPLKVQVGTDARGGIRARASP